jgi:hypothetical protein
VGQGARNSADFSAFQNAEIAKFGRKDANIKISN